MFIRWTERICGKMDYDFQFGVILFRFARWTKGFAIIGFDELNIDNSNRQTDYKVGLLSIFIQMSVVLNTFVSLSEYPRAHSNTEIK